MYIYSYKNRQFQTVCYLRTQTFVKQMKEETELSIVLYCMSQNLLSARFATIQHNIK